jgi:hypothetical protein
MFEVEPIIKNEQGKINCEGITLSYAKNW